MKLARNLFLFFLVGVLLAACGPWQPPSTLRPLRVEFTQWWGDYTLIIAKEKGFFAKYGVEVEPVYYESFPNALPDLAAGNIDIGLFGLGDALNVSRHADLKIIAVYDDGGLDAIVAKPSIRVVADLRNKNIGLQLGTTDELYITEMLRLSGIPNTEVNLVNVEPENIPSRLGQDIDAGFTYEPYISEALTSGNKILFTSKDIGVLTPDVIVVRSEIAQQRPNDLRAFLRAWFEAAEYRKANEIETRRIIANYMGWRLEEVTPDPNLRLITLEDNRIFFGQVQSSTFRPLRQTTQANGLFLISIGSLTKIPNLNAFLDPSFLD